MVIIEKGCKLYKISIDLDVITIAFWKGDKKEIATKFLSRVKNREFIVITPYFLLLNLLKKWTYLDLKDKIQDFYLKNSKMLTNIEIDLKIKSLGIDDIRILKELIKINIKPEDAFLVLITSIFDINYLITFNRKHLKNNENKINGVLKRNGLKIIKIVEPNEI